MNNHTYNLITSLAEKADATWVYDSYKEDSKDCPKCAAMWDEMKKMDEEYVEKMKKLLVSHVKDGVIS